jgi:hypothetical protein
MLSMLLPHIRTPVQAVSLSLTAHPHLNASLSPDATSLTLHGPHNIGVAMDTPQGLAVPNIKQASVVCLGTWYCCVAYYPAMKWPQKLDLRSSAARTSMQNH